MLRLSGALSVQPRTSNTPQQDRVKGHKTSLCDLSCTPKDNMKITLTEPVNWSLPHRQSAQRTGGKNIWKNELVSARLRQHRLKRHLSYSAHSKYVWDCMYYPKSCFFFFYSVPDFLRIRLVIWKLTNSLSPTCNYYRLCLSPTDAIQVQDHVQVTTQLSKTIHRWAERLDGAFWEISSNHVLEQRADEETQSAVLLC